MRGCHIGCERVEWVCSWVCEWANMTFSTRTSPARCLVGATMDGTTTGSTTASTERTPTKEPSMAIFYTNTNNGAIWDRSRCYENIKGKCFQYHASGGGENNSKFTPLFAHIAHVGYMDSFYTSGWTTQTY